MSDMVICRFSGEMPQFAQQWMVLAYTSVTTNRAQHSFPGSTNHQAQGPSLNHIIISIYLSLQLIYTSLSKDVQLHHGRYFSFFLLTQVPISQGRICRTTQPCWSNQVSSLWIMASECSPLLLLLAVFSSRLCWTFWMVSLQFYGMTVISIFCWYSCSVTKSSGITLDDSLRVFSPLLLSSGVLLSFMSNSLDGELAVPSTKIYLLVECCQSNSNCRKVKRKKALFLSECCVCFF